MSWFDVLQIPDFLPAADCAALRSAMREAPGAAASLIDVGDSRSVRPQIRRAALVDPPAALRDALVARLAGALPMLAERFSADLTAFEPLQFLRYGPGDYFVAHQDGNTPMIHDPSRWRRVSLILFLSPQSPTPAPGAYGGGDLVFHAPYPRQERRAIAPRPGTLVAFRSETTHEVAIVEHGERLTVAGWCVTDAV
jgi:predicted 2-oxoglutarate/Fe(II)-dependent dioxygenase YbiX